MYSRRAGLNSTKRTFKERTVTYSQSVCLPVRIPKHARWCPPKHRSTCARGPCDRTHAALIFTDGLQWPVRFFSLTSNWERQVWGHTKTVAGFSSFFFSFFLAWHRVWSQRASDFCINCLWNVVTSNQHDDLCKNVFKVRLHRNSFYLRFMNEVQWQ